MKPTIIEGLLLFGIATVACYQAFGMPEPLGVRYLLVIIVLSSTLLSTLLARAIYQFCYRLFGLEDPWLRRQQGLYFLGYSLVNLLVLQAVSLSNMLVLINPILLVFLAVMVSFWQRLNLSFRAILGANVTFYLMNLLLGILSRWGDAGY